MKNLIVLLLAFSLLWSCEREVDEIRLNKNKIVMHYDEREQLSVTFLPEKANEFPDLIWRTESPNIVRLNVEHQNLKGAYIGSTKLFVHSVDELLADTCIITVVPYFNLFRTPLLSYATKEEIKNFEKRTLLRETENELYYYGEKEHVQLVVYILNEGILYGSMVILDQASCKNAIVYLEERYQKVSDGLEYDIYRINRNTAATIALDTSENTRITYIHGNFSSYQKSLEDSDFVSTQKIPLKQLSNLQIEF